MKPSCNKGLTCQRGLSHAHNPVCGAGSTSQATHIHVEQFAPEIKYTYISTERERFITFDIISHNIPNENNYMFLRPLLGKVYLQPSHHGLFFFFSESQQCNLSHIWLRCTCLHVIAYFCVCECVCYCLSHPENPTKSQQQHSS